MTSAEVTTADLTAVRRAARVFASQHSRYTHQARHRRPADTTRRALLGIPVLLVLGLVGYAWLIHLAGVW